MIRKEWRRATPYLKLPTAIRNIWMMGKTKFIQLLAISVATLVSASALADTVIYAGYPPPGGVTFTPGGGSTIEPGGKTNTYSGFNPSAYGNLYFTIDTAGADGGPPVLGAGSANTLAFDASRSDLANGILVFDGTTTLGLYGELKISITNTASVPLALDSPSLHTGLPAADGGVLRVTGPFQLNAQFLLGPSLSALQPAGPYWDTLHAEGAVGTLVDGFNGGFYYTCQATATSDFDGTCKSDILWQNTSTSQVDIWLMNGTAIAGAGSPAIPGPGWSVAGVGDFNGDGMADILWQNSTTNELVVWLMNGPTIASAGTPGGPSSDWSVRGIGDFNGDGNADILWQNASMGEVVIWFMNGPSIASSLDLGAVPGWSVVGVGDFNGDTKADILWQNQATGEDVIWLMSGTGIIGSGTPGSPGAPWSVAGIGDFNGDGDADILWQNTATGQLVVWLMSGTSIASSGSPGNPGDPGAPWSVQQIGDFNGDGTSDILFYNTATSQIIIWLMNGASIASSGSPGIPGLSWQVQTPPPFKPSRP